jgi:hypothetical protein
MLSITGDRTMQSSIIPPKSSHIFGLVSVLLGKEYLNIELNGLCIPLFFLVQEFALTYHFQKNCLDQILHIPYTIYITVELQFRVQAIAQLYNVGHNSTAFSLKALQ